VGTVDLFPEQDGQTMPRASRSQSRRQHPAIRVAGLAALLAGAVAAACSAPAATPLYSIVVDTTPRPPDNEIARRAFVDKVLAGNLTYHATFAGDVFGAGNSLPVSGSLDVAGADYQLVAVYTLPEVRGEPQEARFSIRYVGGTAWVRMDAGKWADQPDFQPGETNSPFAFVARVTDLRFTKTERVDGATLHHFEFDRSQVIGLKQIQAANLTNEDLKRSTFELVLDDDGTPLSGTARIEGVGRVSGQLQEIIVQLDLVFSKVGADMVIKAP
jgi:hypothetical protein